MAKMTKKEKAEDMVCFLWVFGGILVLGGGAVALMIRSRSPVGADDEVFKRMAVEEG